KRESPPKSERKKDGERSKQESEQTDGTLPDRRRAAEIPRAAKDHHGQRPRVTMPAGGERRAEFAEVENEDGGVDGHVEDTGGEREPAFLKSPERPQSASHPDVKTTLSRKSTRELSNQ